MDYVGSWDICGVLRIVGTDPGLVRIVRTDPGLGRIMGTDPRR